MTTNKDKDDLDLLSRLWQTTTIHERNQGKGSSYEDRHDCIAEFEFDDEVNAFKPSPALFLEHPALAKIVNLLLSPLGQEYFHLDQLESIILMLPSDKYIRIRGSFNEKDAVTAYIVIHAVFRFPRAKIEGFSIECSSEKKDLYSLWKSPWTIDCWMDALKGKVILKRFSFDATNVRNVEFVRNCVFRDMSVVSHDVSRNLHSLLNDQDAWTKLCTQMFQTSLVCMLVFRISANTFFTLQLDYSADANAGDYHKAWFVDLYGTHSNELSEFHPSVDSAFAEYKEPLLSSRNLAPLAVGVGVGVAASGLGYLTFSAVRKFLE